MSPLPPPAPDRASWSCADHLVVWLAQGLGSGRAPMAPGTFGSLVGLAWFALLAIPSSLPFLIAATIAACFLAVPVCSRAEQLLGTKDPGSIVLDEIVAVPLCYLGFCWLGLREDTLFFTLPGATWLAAGFAVFRLLDTLKPPPVGVCQRLPAGWGIVADDVVAAALTGGILTCVARWWG